MTIESGNTLAQIIEDLKFYAEMGLTVKAIRLGMSAWDDLRNSDARLVIESGCQVADSYPKLFGIPVITLTRVNPWARGYTFAETNASVFQLPAAKACDSFCDPMNFTK